MILKRLCLVLLFPIVLATCVNRLAAQEAAFEQANKLYEQGKYVEAAAAYNQIITNHAGAPNLYFNLGNAWFKAGEVGRAIAAWREAEELAPRDPDLRFNLEFARKQVTGSDSPALRSWKRWISSPTLNAWIFGASVGFWVFFLLLAVRELRPSLWRTLRLPAVLAAALCIVCTGASVLAYNQSRIVAAVVIAPQAVVRYGPLEESQVHYQLRDGSEVTVLDQKAAAPGRPAWIRVQDASRRLGWVKQDQLIVIP
jgi:tetratricopeptide (TPR) repeat protein